MRILFSSTLYTMLIVYAFSCCKNVPKSLPNIKPNGDYIILELMCGYFVNDHRISGSAFYENASRVKRIVLSSNQDEYRRVKEAYKYFRPSKFPYMSLDVRIRIQNYQMDTLSNIICMDMLGAASITDSSMITQNDTLKHYIYSCLCR